MLYKGGKSCIANNGFLSSTFPVERSTRQGDPISPLIFILVLEILFISIREDQNIKGIKVFNNEIKLTSYADDATYFLKEKLAAEVLPSKIAQFSNVSGLEVNKIKSECLLLDFELKLSSHELKFCEIPIVENLRILGHYFGKNKLVCDYQNFYSKLSKFDRITTVWQQRGLTILGRNLLINSLLNSLFLFNAQVEVPPCDFIKIIEARNKNFLWEGGVAKIAHHSIIGDFDQGGIRYKDITATIKSMNLKFILRLNCHINTNSMCLPKYWIKQFFNIPTECQDIESRYLSDFFDNQLNILDCKFRLPKKSKWTGHPFYYDTLVNYEMLLESQPNSYESNMSIPLWFNKELDTKFDVRLSKLGINYISDLVKYVANGQGNRPSDFLTTKRVMLLKNKLNPKIQRMVTENSRKTVVIYPFQTVSYKNDDKTLSRLEAKNFYDLLILSKIRLPRGLLGWCMEFELSDQQIKTALNFVQKCSPSIWDRAFQYKISTNTLPTNEYLKRYHVKDSDLCDFCLLECDTVVHRLYDCEVVSRVVRHILNTLHVTCLQPGDISLVEYLFGKIGKDHLALNHIILELKKTIFYSNRTQLSCPGFVELFLCKIRALMIKEKIMFQKRGGYSTFEEKWKDYVFIYDFRGPDKLWPFSY